MAEPTKRLESPLQRRRGAVDVQGARPWAENQPHFQPTVPQQIHALQNLQQTIGNRAVLRLIQSHSDKLDRAADTLIQRDSPSPLDWARDPLNRVTGDADADQADVQDDATTNASGVEAETIRTINGVFGACG